MNVRQFHSEPRRGAGVAARLSAAPRSFSLLEMMIAIGVLGIGLIMIAAIFPAALLRHRDSIDRSRANEIYSKAESLMRARLDPLRLWVDPILIPGNPGAGPPRVGQD